jgi:DNA-binding transcriptional LysR family regulator
MNFRQLDLNLLRVLAAIHRTGSVTLAGKALSLSQPATSNALARLRHHFSDDLFVRAPAGLRPTRLCEKLAPAVQTQLLQLESLLAGHEPFVPIESDMHWRLSLSDLGETLFLPELASALRRQAPGSQLSNTSVSADQVAAALEAREIDLALGFLQPRHKGVRSESLFSGTYVAISSPEWRPASGRIGATLTRRQMADAAYVVAAPTATLHSGVAMVLARMQLEHRIVLRARHFGALPELALGTDLLSIVPQMYARKLSQRYGFRIWGITGAPSYEVRLVWHGSTDRDPAHQWMRDLVRQLFCPPPWGQV